MSVLVSETIMISMFRKTASDKSSILFLIEFMLIDQLNNLTASLFGNALGTRYDILVIDIYHDNLFYACVNRKCLNQKIFQVYKKLLKFSCYHVDASY